MFNEQYSGLKLCIKDFELFYIFAPLYPFDSDSKHFKM